MSIAALDAQGCDGSKTLKIWDASQRASIRADSYDRDKADIFRVQGEITACVAAAIENGVGVVEKAEAGRASPENLAAWSCYQRAMSRLRNDAAFMEREEIADLFDQAIERNPVFAWPMPGRPSGRLDPYRRPEAGRF